MLNFIAIITTLFLLSTAHAANAGHHTKPDSDVQQCGRAWGEFAHFDAGTIACLNYGSYHYSCPKDSCATGQAPKVGQKSASSNPTFSGCAKFLGTWGDTKNLDTQKVTITAVSYWFQYKNNTLTAIGYDSTLKTQPPAPLPGYFCPVPDNPTQFIEVCRNCTHLEDAKW